MKCPKPDCGVENRDGARFCRACGSELIKSEISVMEKFPEYSFAPTSITKIEGSSGIPELILMIITGSILAATLEQFELGLVGGLCILIPFSVIMFIVYFKRVSDIDLSSKFDYVETTNNKTYKFVIKNSKFVKSLQQRLGEMSLILTFTEID